MKTQKQEATDRRVFSTNIGDVANVRPRRGSFDQGMVTMISYRGINITTAQETKFIKWENVISILENLACRRDA